MYHIFAHKNHFLKVVDTANTQIEAVQKVEYYRRQIGDGWFVWSLKKLV